MTGDIHIDTPELPAHTTDVQPRSPEGTRMHSAVRRAVAPLALIILSLTLFVSCGDDTSTTSPPPPPSGPRADVVGTILDGDGEPLATVRVVVAGRDAHTTVDGIFVIRDAPVADGRAVLTATRDGFFDAVKAITVRDGKAAVTLQLQERDLAGTVDAATGGTVTTSDGLVVTLPPDAIAGGYTGDVHVYADLIDTSSLDDVLQIPGLEAENDAGESGVLESYGMGTIEIEDDAGNLLQLAEGISAELTFPLSAEQLTGAPSTIALWFFDDDAGIWREEGSASLVDDAYVGDVPHFSRWNCDRFVCGTQAVVRFLGDGEPLVDATILLRHESRPWIGPSIEHTDENGQIIAALPCDEPVSAYLFITGGSEPCLWFLGTITATESGEGGVIVIDADTPAFAEVIGTAVSCSGAPVRNGYVYGTVGAQRSPVALTDDDGRFRLKAYDCAETSTEMLLVGWDLDGFISDTGPAIPLSSETTTLGKPFRICGEVGSTEGRIFLPVRNRSLLCLDASDGSTIWTFTSTRDFAGAPTVEDDLVYIGDADGVVYCLNGADGSLVWKRSLGGRIGSSPFVDADAVYVGSTLNRVYSLNRADGTSRWSADLGQDVTTSQTGFGDVIFASGSTWNDAVYGLDRATGAELWEYRTTDGGMFSPCHADGRVFAGSGFPDARVFAVDAATGKFLWQSDPAEGNCYSSPTEEDGVVYTLCGKHLFAHDAADGDLVWEYIDERNGANSAYGPILDGAGRIFAAFVSFEGDDIRSFDTATGSVGWTAPLRATGASLVMDGILFTAVQDSTLRALEAATGREVWSAPLPAQGLHPTGVDEAGASHYVSESGMRN